MSEEENVSGGVVELDVLAVFSHPDDAELTAAGTLIKMKSLGYRTGVLDVTRGEMGTRGSPEVRAEEAREAARLMGLDVRLNLEQPDGHVWPTEEARRALVRVIRAHKPKVILTAHWDDPHPDHANTARIVRESARLASMRRYDEEAGQGAVKESPPAHTAHPPPRPPPFIVGTSHPNKDQKPPLLPRPQPLSDPPSRATHHRHRATRRLP